MVSTLVFGGTSAKRRGTHAQRGKLLYAQLTLLPGLLDLLTPSCAGSGSRKWGWEWGSSSSASLLLPSSSVTFGDCSHWVLRVHGAGGLRSLQQGADLCLKLIFQFC